ncbi:MAG: hypothetical protein GY874_19080 [Desulfobacteraceae bacterium]|nr:hypothetical protein [Desulfobacteraceae bacterium]
MERCSDSYRNWHYIFSANCIYLPSCKLGNARSDEPISLKMLATSLWEGVCLGFPIWKNTLPSAQHIVILARVIEPLRRAAPEHGSSIDAANDQWQTPPSLASSCF